MDDNSTYFRSNAFAGHRDTLARIPFPMIHDHDTDDWVDSSPTLASEQPFASESMFDALAWDQHDSIPRTALESILGILPFDDYKNLRLVCRRWYKALPQPHFPASYKLPNEIIEQIYGHLSPADFDAARHTCWGWYMAGLSPNIQNLMIIRQGCRSASERDITARRRRAKDQVTGFEVNLTSGDADSDADCSWIRAKRLATECRLSSDWPGSSVLDEEHGQRLSTIEEIDFSRLFLTNDFSDVFAQPRKFTVSACRKFVCATFCGDISVYSICDLEESFKPIVRLVAGAEVLKVSMDTSSNRFSVAALLAGRRGMLWDLVGDGSRARHRYHPEDTIALGMHAEVQGSATVQSSRTVSAAVSTTSSQPRPLLKHSHGLKAANLRSRFPSEQALLITEASAKSAGRGSSVFWHEMLFPLNNLESDSSEGEGSGGPRRRGVPIETRPTAVFYNLGSRDDPPKSVAICPNRKCVAFGCRMGIELHWVDALTGGDLCRWFPLAAPSDFLFFLPQRPGIDSRRKLRLISSAAGSVSTHLVRADSTPAKWKPWPSQSSHGRRQSLTRLFFGSLPFPTPASSPSQPGTSPTESSEESQGVLRTVDCDHYRAIPLSDGSHMLFTDPETGLLCLGSDAPLGAPTKLIRKVVFIPPVASHCKRCPTHYTAGASLLWGIRIVAVYDDRLVVLYNIPRDIFERLETGNTASDVWDEGSGVIGQSDLLMDSLMPTRSNSSANSLESEMSERSRVSWPLKVEGSIVSDYEGEVVDDMAVDANDGGFWMWVFLRSGKAISASLYAPRNFEVRKRDVGEDGLLYDTQLGSHRLSWKRGKRPKLAASESMRDRTRHVTWAGTVSDGGCSLMQAQCKALLGQGREDNPE